MNSTFRFGKSSEPAVAFWMAVSHAAALLNMKGESRVPVPGHQVRARVGARVGARRLSSEVKRGRQRSMRTALANRQIR